MVSSNTYVRRRAFAPSTREVLGESSAFQEPPILSSHSSFNETQAGALQVLKHTAVYGERTGVYRKMVLLVINNARVLCIG